MNRFLHFWLGPLVAALLVGYVATLWGLRLWLGAPNDALAPPPPRADVFPAAPAQMAVATKPAAMPMPAGNVALIGTVIPRDTNEPKRAVMRIDGKAIDVEEGVSFANGLTLSRVERQAVVLTRDGKEERVELAKQSAQSVVAITRPPPSAPAPTNVTAASVAAGCPASVEQRRSGIVLNTEMLVGALQNQTSLDAMLQPVGNGLAVRNTAGVGALLGLRDGDVLRAVGGARVTQPRDLAALALVPLSKAQIVTVEIERAGATQILTYLPPGCKA